MSHELSSSKYHTQLLPTFVPFPVQQFSGQKALGLLMPFFQISTVPFSIIPISTFCRRQLILVPEAPRKECLPSCLSSLGWSEENRAFTRCPLLFRLLLGNKCMSFTQSQPCRWYFLPHQEAETQSSKSVNLTVSQPGS